MNVGEVRRRDPAGDAQTIEGLAPLVDRRCRVLVLGSMPSARSIATRSYYAHPRNQFWPIMGLLFAAGPELAYADRVRRLQAADVGLWDVLAGCERQGSLDSRIVAGSERPNAIAACIATLPSLAAVALNGGKADTLFRRWIAPGLPAVVRATLVVVALPSTSPAHASMSLTEKAERWRVLQDFARASVPPP